MRQLELNEQEWEILVEILKSFLSDLRSEISHTDNHDFRGGLKSKELQVKAILGKLDQSPER